MLRSLVMAGRNDLYGRLLSREPTQGRNYVLNAWGAVMSAVTVLAVQLFTTRVLGAEAAGRVSVDAATVLLCYHLGQLNMRPYQCTDLRQRFSFSEYLSLKAATVLLMLAVCLGYTLVRGYDGQRRLFCLALCVFKGAAAFSDCFWGMLQQRERIDLAGLGGALYELAGTLVFAVILYATRSLSAAALAMAGLGILHFFLYTLPLGRRMETVKLSSDGRRILRLAAILIPLFAAGYFMNISITLPKYALERYGGEAVLGLFTAVYMPAQGVLLVSSFLYYPRLTALAAFADAGDRRGFLRLLGRLCAAVILVDLCIAAGGWLFGTQILGWLFGLELFACRADLVLILLGGGFFALYSLFCYALIAMRAQKGLVPLTLGILAAAAAMNWLLVSRLGLRGASLSYLLSVIFAAILILIKTALALGRMKEGGGPDEAP